MGSFIKEVLNSFEIPVISMYISKEKNLRENKILTKEEIAKIIEEKTDYLKREYELRKKSAATYCKRIY